MSPLCCEPAVSVCRSVYPLYYETLCVYPLCYEPAVSVCRSVYPASCRSLTCMLECVSCYLQILDMYAGVCMLLSADPAGTSQILCPCAIPFLDPEVAEMFLTKKKALLKGIPF